VVPNRRLVFTTAHGPGYRPQDHDLPFTAIITLEPKGKGTRYHVLARHKDEATAKQHLEMGFHEGWSKVLDQLARWRTPGSGRAEAGCHHGLVRLLFGAFRDMIDVKERPGELDKRAVSWRGGRHAA
jgi:activator of Hsp90 ATPase-like protein